ncbi:ATP synthase F1 subunit gamma [Candidatus Peregrinibacteria bacterium]|nr:MAG: ATP synthase F1 subunit gamma [Candidatus Peregrinibacteria bacterium]
MSGLLIETKKKIGSFKNTRKITKAMELVAASKMKFFQKKAVHSRIFAHDLLNILSRNLNGDSVNGLMEQRSEGKTIFILFTSDKGLCGALNNRLIKGIFQSNEWLNTPKEDRLLMTIGKKSLSYALFNKIPVEKSFVSLKENMTPIDAIDVIGELIKRWEKGDVKQVMMMSPHYKNAFTYYPILKTFLPFSVENLKQHIGTDSDLKPLKKEENDYMLYEPSEAAVLEHLTRELVNTLFIQAFFELKASEYSSRMIAMKNATDSTNKIIENLTIDLNKARQQVITTELADLINSSEAIKDT